MTEVLQNSYRSLEVSALANEGMAHEARRQAEALLKYAEQKEGIATALREEMARIALRLTEGERDEDR